jgi:flagellar M-ring protein FliF
MAAKNQIAAPKPPVAAAQVTERIKLFWAGLRPQQRIYLGVGLAVTLGVAAFFVKMIATPTYKPLMTGLEPADAQAITVQLTAKKIPYVIGPDGTSINVPADQVGWKSHRTI